MCDLCKCSGFSGMNEIQHEDGEFYLSVDCSGGIMKINYCPICGRKLVGDVND